MRTRILILLFAVLSVWPMMGQEIELNLTDGPIATPIQFPETAIGDTNQLRIRIRNNITGTAIKLIAVGNTDSCNNVNFAICISSPPAIPPGGILFGQSVVFSVRFSPDASEIYSADMMVGYSAGSDTIVPNFAAFQGEGIGSARLLSSNGSELLSGATIDFGKPLLGSSTEQTFTLKNNSGVDVTIPSASIESQQWRVACPGSSQQPVDIDTSKPPFTSDLPETAIDLEAGKEKIFTITYHPLAPEFDKPSCFEATLLLGTRSFTLFGNGVLLPNAPQPTFTFNTTNFTSQQQPSITIQLAGVAPRRLPATLKLEFQPAITGVLDDPAIYFLATQGRTLSLVIEEGSDKATFQGQSEFTFQTGTTAGTILFTLELDGKIIQQSVTISPSTIQLNSARAVRQSPSLQVLLTGFDNTYTASQLSFTFYDSAGNTIKPGLMNVDATQNFRDYFAQTQVGGMFSLLANFPVTGSASEVASVDVSIRNANGTTRTNRLQF